MSRYALGLSWFDLSIGKYDDYYHLFSNIGNITHIFRRCQIEDGSYSFIFEQSVSFYLPFISLLREADYKKREEISRMSGWMIIHLEFHTIRQRDYVISFSCCPDRNHDLCGIRASMIIVD